MGMLLPTYFAPPEKEGELALAANSRSWRPIRSSITCLIRCPSRP